MKEQLDTSMCVQVCRTIELNYDSQSHVLLLKHQDSERIGKQLNQKRNFCEFKQDLKIRYPLSQSSDQWKHFAWKLLMESNFEGKKPLKVTSRVWNQTPII